MSSGYGVGLVERNHTANERLLGVRLGRLCIRKGVSATEVARRLGVSRQTVYNWFRGTCSPQNTMQDAVEALIASLGY